MAGDPTKPKSNRGRKKITRPKLGLVRVQREVFDALDAMVSDTGMPAPENAAMLLHWLITDPENAAAKLKALRKNGAAGSAEK